MVNMSINPLPLSTPPSSETVLKQGFSSVQTSPRGFHFFSYSNFWLKCVYGWALTGGAERLPLGLSRQRQWPYLEQWLIYQKKGNSSIGLNSCYFQEKKLWWHRLRKSVRQCCWKTKYNLKRVKIKNSVHIFYLIIILQFQY